MPERRLQHELRREISRREQRKSTKQLIWAVAVQVVVTCVLLAAIFVSLSATAREAAVTTREGCQSGNYTRAYIRIYGNALNVARDDGHVAGVTGIEAANPIIDCDQLPGERVALPEAAAARFTEFVRLGEKPVVHGGQINLNP